MLMNPIIIKYKYGAAITNYSKVIRFFDYIVIYLIIQLSMAAILYAQMKPRDLSELTLEELMKQEVSISKKPEKLLQVTAAISLLTADDARRLGYTQIPQLLTLVPGLEKASIDANKWAIGIRGFNSRFTNKLLVLVDGRSVYTPMFSGVFWETLDVVMEDIERIEIIRGPGGTMWGTNAVNGIIDIITKNANKTEGGLFTTQISSESGTSSMFRYGGKLNENFHYRFYSKYSNYPNSVHASGKPADDSWNFLQNGFRCDWAQSAAEAADTISVHGDFFYGRAWQFYQIIESIEKPFITPVQYHARLTDGNILGRWEHQFSRRSDFAVQLYYNLEERRDAVIKGAAHTYDVDFQHRYLLHQNHDLVWGLGYRYVTDQLRGTFCFDILPHARDYQLFSGFIQDDITLVSDHFKSIVGVKIEKNDFSGMEIQPNLRLLFLPAKQHTIWTAVTRAVRSPSRTDEDVHALIYATPPNAFLPTTLTFIDGSHDFEAEKLYAFEAGYRAQVNDYFFYDITSYYNLYRQHRSFEFGDFQKKNIADIEYFHVPITIDNKMYGETYGCEVMLDYRLNHWFRLRSHYSFIKLFMHLKKDSRDQFSKSMSGGSPEHQFSVWGAFDPHRNWQVDMRLRFVDSLPDLHVNSYYDLDCRIGWAPILHLDISISGHHLLHDHHPEYSIPLGLYLPTQGYSISTEVERTFQAVIAWRF